MCTHRVIRRTVQCDFMGDFWDRKGSIDFCPVAGCARPFQRNLAVVDGDQPGQTDFVNLCPLTMSEDVVLTWTSSGQARYHLRPPLHL